MPRIEPLHQNAPRMAPLAYPQNYGQRRFGDHAETVGAAVKINLIETNSDCVSAFDCKP